MKGASQRPALGMLAVALAALVFSWGFIIVKALPLPPSAVAFYRLTIAAATLSSVAVAARVPWPSSWPSVLGAGVFFGLHQLLYIAATQATSVAIVTLIGATQPLLVALLVARVTTERVGRGTVSFAALSVMGVASVVVANFHDESRTAWGDLLAVFNILAFTGFFLLSKRARVQGAHTLTLTASVLWVAWLVVLPVFLLEGPAGPVGRSSIGLLVLLALGPGNGHLLLNWAHRHTSAAVASLVLTAVPILASLWAHLLFDEPLGLVHLFGATCVAVSVEGARRSQVSRD